MNKFLQKLLAIDLPSSDEVQEHMEQQQQQAEQAPVRPQGVPRVDNVLPVASISINMMNASDCKILIQWDEHSQGDILAKQFAKVLYQLNEGDMKATIARIIMSHGESVGSAEFTHKIMEEWESLYEEHDDEPVVLPSEALPPGQ